MTALAARVSAGWIRRVRAWLGERTSTLRSVSDGRIRRARAWLGTWISTLRTVSAGWIARARVWLGAAVSTLRTVRAPGTGVATLDARSDFQRARRTYLATRFLGGLTPGRTRRTRPCALDGVGALSWGSARLRVIPLPAVVGTVDATHDFDARFRPAAAHLASRWQRVALAQRQGTQLPPISVIERPEGYYVLDGRHRVSVGRARGQRDIEAWVSPVLPVHSSAQRTLSTTTTTSR